MRATLLLLLVSSVALAQYKPGGGKSSSSGITLSGSFGSSPATAGATLTSTVLQLQPADATHGGGVSTTTQTFAGDKTFNGAVISSVANGANAIIFSNEGAKFCLNSGCTEKIAGNTFGDGLNITVSSNVVVNAPGGLIATFGIQAGNFNTNHLTLAGSSTGNPVTITALGGDGNVGINLVTVGSGTAQVNGKVLPVQHSATAQALESGSGTATAGGVLAVTFGTAFASAPNCTCADQNATPVSCGISTAASSSGVTFTVGSARADTVQWICMGAK